MTPEQARLVNALLRRVRNAAELAGDMDDEDPALLAWLAAGSPLVPEVEASQDSAREEREAWDRYAAAALLPVDPETDDASNDTVKVAARYADALLTERRKRFGGER